MLVAWKPRRANSAAAVVDDLLLAAVVALAERGGCRGLRHSIL